MREFKNGRSSNRTVRKHELRKEKRVARRLSAPGSLETDRCCPTDEPKEESPLLRPSANTGLRLRPSATLQPSTRSNLGGPRRNAETNWRPGNTTLGGHPHETKQRDEHATNDTSAFQLSGLGLKEGMETWDVKNEVAPRLSPGLKPSLGRRPENRSASD